MFFWLVNFNPLKLITLPFKVIGDLIILFGVIFLAMTIFNTTWFGTITLLGSISLVIFFWNALMGTRGFFGKFLVIFFVLMIGYMSLFLM